MVTCDPESDVYSNKTLYPSLSLRSRSFVFGTFFDVRKVTNIDCGNLRNHHPLILQEFLMRSEMSTRMCTRQAWYLHLRIWYVWRDAVAESMIFASFYGQYRELAANSDRYSNPTLRSRYPHDHAATNSLVPTLPSSVPIWFRILLSVVLYNNFPTIRLPIYEYDTWVFQSDDP
jgi:hypothetical protein